MGFVEVLGTVTAVLVLISTCLYAYQVVYMFLPLIPRKRKHKEIKMHRYALLVPARNEKNVIGHLLRSIAAQDYPQELIKVYVIADNCTDETAQIAREHGATVFERFNKEQVGKGYALNYLMENIDKTVGLDQHDVFMIFDADNLLEPDYLSKINQTFSDGYEAACGFRNTKNFDSNWISAGYGVWYLHDSSHLNRSRSWLNVGCGVSGTGFGFTRQLLEKIGGWHFFTLTEDLEFNAWCNSHRVKIGYCHDAVLYDEQPFKFAVSWRQRVRWVQGGYQMVPRYSGGLFKGIFKGGWQSYSCLENLTLTPWGAWLAFLSGGLTILMTLLTTPFLDAVLVGLGAVAGAYVGMAVMGLITVAMEWKRIRASKLRRIWGALVFPMFLITFMVISIVAPFCKFQWVPIAHTVAVDNDQLHK